MMNMAYRHDWLTISSYSHGHASSHGAISSPSETHLT